MSTSFLKLGEQHEVSVNDNRCTMRYMGISVREIPVRVHHPGLKLPWGTNAYWTCSEAAEKEYRRPDQDAEVADKIHDPVLLCLLKELDAASAVRIQEIPGCLLP